MSITIGERSLATTRPDDLDAKLIATTGCSAAEHASMLHEGGTPFTVARALAPLLAEPMPVADLAALIAGGNVAVARRDTVALLNAPDPASAPAPLPAPEPIVDADPAQVPAATTEG